MNKTRRASLDRYATRTVVSGRKAIIVHIDWTNAEIVHTTINREMRLFVQAHDSKTGALIQRGSMILHAGMRVHFVKSATFGDGAYYVVVAGESCTCTAGLNKQHCKHQAAINPAGELIAA